MRITITALFLVFSSTVPGLAEQEVVVLNLPEVQRVKGEVSIAEPVSIATTKLVSLPEEVVPTVLPAETTSLVPGGLIEADGFRTAVVSLAGLVRGQSMAEGEVGAILLPDDEEILKLFDDEARILLELEVSVATEPASAYFSGSESVTLAFPRYRVFYYNTTDRAVSVRLYAYLAN
jgi:hypothetical protein